MCLNEFQEQPHEQIGIMESDEIIMLDDDEGDGDEDEKTFIDDIIKDGIGVNKIFGDYVEKARSSWRKKDKNKCEEDYVRIVKKIRTIIKISQHNLKLLDKNLLDGFKTEFPHHRLENLAVSIPADSLSPKKEKHDDDNDDPLANGHQNNDSKDMFEDDEDMDENQRARKVVLQTTSSDNDGEKAGADVEVSPRKKLKTKKELDDLRRKSFAEDSDSHENSDDEEEVSDDRDDDEESPRQKSKKKNFSKDQKQSYSKLYAKASKIKISSNRKLNMKAKVDLESINEDVLRELKKKDMVVKLDCKRIN